MSRTYRDVAYSNTCARGIRYRNQYKNSVAWVEEMRDENYEPRNRDKAIARRHYLNSWDDYNVSGWNEMSWLFEFISEDVDELSVGACRWKEWEKAAVKYINKAKKNK